MQDTHRCAFLNARGKLSTSDEIKSYNVLSHACTTVERSSASCHRNRKLCLDIPFAERTRRRTSDPMITGSSSEGMLAALCKPCVCVCVCVCVCADSPDHETFSTPWPMPGCNPRTLFPSGERFVIEQTNMTAVSAAPGDEQIHRYTPMDEGINN